jgi:general secretion pathway protein K
MPSAPEARQRGFALVVVLWIVTLLALQVSIFSLAIRDAGALAGNELAIARGEALAAAGVEMAAAQLMQPEEQRRWPADGSTREVRFGGARLAITVTDEAGRLDINEIDGDLADAILRPIGGTTELMTQWIDRNGPLHDPSDLAHALGLPAGAVRLLLPYLTVHGGDGRINPMAAPREALLMLPGADPGEVELALRIRQSPGATAADVAQALRSVDKWLTERTGPAYRVEVAVQGESTPAIGHLEAVILLGKDGAAPFRVLGWRYEPTSSGRRE